MSELCADEVVEELNPFSYKEFLRWKSRDAEPDKQPKPALDLDLDIDLDLEHTRSQVAELSLHSLQQTGKVY